MPNVHSTLQPAAGHSTHHAPSGHSTHHAPAGHSTHNAPAGQTYACIEHAGYCILCKFYEKFPSTYRSFIAPPIFRVLYPEKYDATGEVERATRVLSRGEENKLRGIVVNSSGETAEYIVFKVFERLITRSNSTPILILRSFQLDTSTSLRRDALRTELGINVAQKGEFDAVVIIHNVGIVLIEIKRKRTADQQNKAETQLFNGRVFFQTLMKGITGIQNQDLPIVTVVIFATETTASPTVKSPRGNHIICSDILASFDSKWDSIVNEVFVLYSTNPINNTYFERFTNFTTGMWAMEPLRRTFTFSNNKSSVTHLIKANDEMIDQAVLSSDVTTGKSEAARANPVTNVEYVASGDIARTATDMNMMYMAPAQKGLFDDIPQAIIRAPAGAGKTLLGTLKVLDIFDKHPIKNILIIAPHPHHLRMEKSLRLNNVPSTIVEEFPPPANSTDVVIMTLKNFFLVPKSKLLSYDVSLHHMLIDDLQCLSFVRSVDTRFPDVAEFIDRTYTTSLRNDLLLWCGVDEMQSVGLITTDTYSVLSMFHVNEITPRIFSIPIVELKDILRNSLEISTVVQRTREMRITERSRYMSSAHVPQNIGTGHMIRSECVRYEKLKKGTDGTFIEQFLKDRITDIFTSLHIVSPPPQQPPPQPQQQQQQQQQQPSLNMSDIAVLLDYSTHAQTIRDHIFNTYTIQCQTIEEYIRNDTTDHVIVDVMGNVMSFECPVVVYVRAEEYGVAYNNYFFNMTSRARTSLHIVDIQVNKPPFITDDVNLVQWHVVNNRICKM